MVGFRVQCLAGKGGFRNPGPEGTSSSRDSTPPPGESPVFPHNHFRVGLQLNAWNLGIPGLVAPPLQIGPEMSTVRPPPALTLRTAQHAHSAPCPSTCRSALTLRNMQLRMTAAPDRLSTASANSWHSLKGGTVGEVTGVH